MRKRIAHALESDPLQSTNNLSSSRIEDKTVDGFMITEKYVDVEGFYEVNHDGARLEHTVTERMYITKHNGRYHVRIEQARASDELHVFKKTWVPQLPAPDKFEPIEVTPRRLNTTLALFVEGTRKGYIK